MTARDSADAIRLAPADNVATVLRPVAAGEHIRVTYRGETETVTAAQPIPLCHKISLSPILAGSPVRKFGEVIGEATVDIARGAHVHTHNLISCRGRTSK